MKHIFISIFLIVSCNQPDSAKKESIQPIDSSISNESKKSIVAPNPDTVISNLKKKPVTTPGRKIDTLLLLKTSTQILSYIKDRNYSKFASFIHPKNSIRFSPYAYIDTADNLLLSYKQFIHLVNQKKAINWNSAWDSEMEPEIFTVDQYFKKYVYDVDFLNAKLKSINKYHSQGTDLNNINEIYPDCNVVEFFFPGFEEKYGGMDFRALRLVFKIENKKLYLVAIVHDEWTP